MESGLIKNKEYEVIVPKFKLRGKWRMQGHIVSMTEEELIFFSIYVKPYKPVVTTKDLKGLIKGSNKGLIKGGKNES